MGALATGVSSRGRRTAAAVGAALAVVIAGVMFAHVGASRGEVVSAGSSTPTLRDQHWPDARVWAHVIPHGLPEFSADGNGSQNVYGDLYPLDLVEGDAKAVLRPTTGVPRALQAGITGVQVLQFEGNRGSDFVTDWFRQADPTWTDANPYNDFMVAPSLHASDVADVVRLIREYASASEGHPSAARIGTKLVFYVYDTYALSPDSWREVRQRLGSLDASTYLIANLQTNVSQTGHKLNQRRMLQYSGIFEADFDFDDSVEYVWNDLIKALNANGRQYAGGFMPGYDRQTCGDDAACGHIDALGTARYRKLWELALRSGSSWQNVITWNDMVERTEVQATSNWSSTRADITAFYSAKLRHIAFPKPKAALYITTPQAIRLGDAVKAEGLVLNGSARTVTVSTVLLNNRSQPISVATTATVAPGTSGAATTSAAAQVTTMPTGRFLRARTDVYDTQNGTHLQSVTSAPIVVYTTDASPTPSFHRLYYSIPADHALTAKPTLTLSANPTTTTNATATVTAPANTTVRFSEILQNTRQVANGFTATPFTVHVPMPPRTIIGGQVTSAAPDGFYIGRVIDEQEHIAYTDPIYVGKGMLNVTLRYSRRTLGSSAIH